MDENRRDYGGKIWDTMTSVVSDPTLRMVTLRYIFNGLQSEGRDLTVLQNKY